MLDAQKEDETGEPAPSVSSCGVDHFGDETASAMSDGGASRERSAKKGQTKGGCLGCIRKMLGRNRGVAVLGEARDLAAEANARLQAELEAFMAHAADPRYGNHSRLRPAAEGPERGAAEHRHMGLDDDGVGPPMPDDWPDGWPWPPPSMQEELDRKRHARLEAAAKEAAAAKAAAIGRSKAAGAAVVAAGTLSHAALVAKGSPGDDGELRSPMRSPMRSPRPPEGGGPKVSPRRLRAPKGFCSSVEQLAVAVEATKARLHELRASGALDPQPASPSHSDSIADGLRGKLDQLESKQWKRIEKKVRNVEKSWGVKDSQEEQAKLLEAERLSEERLRKLEDDNAPMHPEVPVEQEPLAADDRPWGVAVVEWLAKRGVRAHKGTVADRVIDMLTSLGYQPSNWVKMLSMMTEEDIFLLQLEARIEHSNHLEAVKEYEKAKLRYEVGFKESLGDVQNGTGQLRSSALTAKQRWLKVRTAVHMGSIVATAIETMEEKKRAHALVVQQMEEARFAEQAVLNEINEAEAAAKVAEARKQELSNMLEILQVEQAEVDAACAARDKAQAAHEKALELHTAALKALETAGGRLKLVKCAGIKAADVGGKSDPYCVIKWNDKILDRTEILHNAEEPVFQHLIQFDQPGGISTDYKNELKIEAWDYDESSEDEFLGAVILHGKGDHFLRVDHAQMRDHEMVSDVGRTTRFVGGTMTLGGFYYDKTDAKAEVELCEKAVRESKELLDEKSSSLSKESHEVEEMMAELTRDQKIADMAQRRAQKEKKDAEVALQRFRQEQAEARHARLQVPFKIVPTDANELRKLQIQLDSLQQSLQRYQQYFGGSSPAIAHIFKSMAKTLERKGDCVEAAVRGGQAGVAIVSGGNIDEVKPAGCGQWAD